MTPRLALVLVHKERARIFFQRALIVRHAEGGQIAAVLTTVADQDYLFNDREIGGTIGPISIQDVTQNPRVGSYEPLLERVLLPLFIAKAEADDPMLQAGEIQLQRVGQQ